MAPISSTSQIAGYAFLVPPGQPANFTTTDGLVIEDTEEGHLVMVNGTLIHLVMKKPFKDSQLNELLYVIIVIVFYATALMTLIITQIKRQRREGCDVDYYDEYLQRNQEVKRTCQTATNLVLKTDKPPSSSSAATASTSLPASSSQSLLEPPHGLPRGREPPSRSHLRLGLVGSAGMGRAMGVGGGGGGGVGAGGSGDAARDASPMLESIPDVGT